MSTYLGVSSLLLYQDEKNKSWDQQNYLIIRGFSYIRPLKVPLYLFNIYLFIYISCGMVYTNDGMMQFTCITCPLKHFDPKITDMKKSVSLSSDMIDYLWQNLYP